MARLRGHRTTARQELRVFAYSARQRQKCPQISPILAFIGLQLREAADDDRVADEPAVRHVERLWVEVVCRVAKHGDPETMTLQAYHHAIAKPGGWLGRRGDGRPGWQTLWRGWQLIAAYVTGIELMQGASP